MGVIEKRYWGSIGNDMRLVSYEQTDMESIFHRGPSRIFPLRAHPRRRLRDGSPVFGQTRLSRTCVRPEKASTTGTHRTIGMMIFFRAWDKRRAT